MTAILLYAKRQAVRTIHSPRRLNVLLLLMLAIAALGIVLLFQSPGFSVQYDGARVPVIVPAEAELCAGETLHYPITVTIEEREIPGQLQIAEAWCKAGIGGSCVGVVPPRPNLPLLEPKSIVSQSSRVVPDTLTPGVYHLWHSSTNSRGQVSGYIVAPVTVADCPAP